MGIIQSFLRFFGFHPYDEEAVIDFPGREESARVSELLEYRPAVQTENQPIKVSKDVKISIVRPELTKLGKLNYSLSVYTESLKEGYILLVDVGKLLSQSRDEARRIIHFLTGVTEALGGTKREVVRNLYLFVPPGVNVRGGDHMDDY